MILIGRNLSPFVRRTAASLRLMGFPHEHRALSVLDHREAITAANPLGRVPSLILPDGETLIDSSAILDALDEMAGPERRLTPADGPARRAVLRAVALGLGAMEKIVQAYYERDRRPPEFRWPDGIARLAAQGVEGLAALDQLAAAAPAGAWLCGPELTQADVTATVAHDFCALVMPDALGGRVPALAALAARANAIPAIGETRWVG
jgi:glutathione S-transferase